ncbi:hexosaminidase D [Engraulis encrasicolus]|uniref:hexosaminidase D n=1 Tax=Engraulis encrasicolus TaxID=184585 RepID=UPI002FD73418
MSPLGKKLVHLDLKGAPPKFDYLLKLIHLFADLGANGLLIEYEDMFPYEGDLESIRASAHPPYSREEIAILQDTAKSRNLEVIPLVQTFGHMEFVLKHGAFRELREVGHCLGTLNPHKERAVQLVLEMLRQVMELHPGSSSLHLGADEVYLLGQGEESRQWLTSPNRSVHQLFLGHVTRVAKAVRDRHPDLSLIMWDDMLRGMSLETLKESGLVGLVQPMIWDYSPVLDVENTVLLMDKYSSSGLSQLWTASSFKGSTCVHTCVPSTQRHVDNHLQWLKVASSRPAAVTLQGIALTGWQRYDHLSVLCELLPVALPSLASCLQTLIYGSFSAEAQTRVTEILGTPTEVEDISSLSPENSTSFPGQKLAASMVELTSLLQSEDLRLFESNMYVRGWFTPYHRRRKIAHPLIAQQIQIQVMALLQAVEPRAEEVRQEMGLLYPQATVEEWAEQHVSAVLAPLHSLLKDLQLAMEDMGLHAPVPPSGW